MAYHKGTYGESLAVDDNEDELPMPNNGNVSRLLNDVQKQLAILHEELGGLANRLRSVSRSLPTESEIEGMTDGPKDSMSPLAETVQIVLKQVRDATARVSEIKAGVDL